MNTFRKLPDGNWGVMSDANIEPGAVVTVVLKNGSTKKATIGERVGTYQDKILYAVAKPNGAIANELRVLMEDVIAEFKNSGGQTNDRVALAINRLSDYIKR